jgi:hypothetical protein
MLTDLRYKIIGLRFLQPPKEHSTPISRQREKTTRRPRPLPPNWSSESVMKLLPSTWIAKGEGAQRGNGGFRFRLIVPHMIREAVFLDGERICHAAISQQSAPSLWMMHVVRLAIVLVS